jgi:hypothetical protein
MKNFLRWGILIVWFIFNSARVFAQSNEPVLKIVSPAQGTIVSPGQMLTVVVDVPLEVHFTNGIFISGDLGDAGPMTAQPYTFNMGPIPQDSPIGEIRIIATGTKTNGEQIISAPLALRVERIDHALSIDADPQYLSFKVIGDQETLTVTGKFSDGTKLILNESSKIHFKVNDDSVITVNDIGMVTARGFGETNLMITYEEHTKNITVRVADSIPGDLDGDGQVDTDDFNWLLGKINSLATSPWDAADLNHDGEINKQDLEMLKTLCDKPNCVGSEVVVPHVVGLTEEEARNRITNNGLSVGMVGLDVTNKKFEGLIVDQSPIPRAVVPAGTIVNLVWAWTCTVPDQLAECSGQNGTTITLDCSLPNSINGDSLSFEWRDVNGNLVARTAIANFTLSVGLHPFTVTVYDGNGNKGSKKIIVTVQDTIPSKLDITLSLNELWPPNHRLIRINAAITTNDVCDLNPHVSLVSITSSEPDKELEKDDAVGDIQEANYGTDDRSFLLRAERSGSGNGRIYTVTYKATDSSGNSTIRTAEVRVPHDQGK